MGSYISRTMSEDDSRTVSDSESDSDQDYRTMLRSLINSGQVQIQVPLFVRGSSPEYLKSPKITRKHCTKSLDDSEFSLITRQDSGLSEPKIRRAKNVTKLMTNREIGFYPNDCFSKNKKCSISNRYLPNEMSLLDNSSGKVFCGVFSKDGSRFITAAQDRSIRLYNSDDGSYKFIRSIRARDVGWSIIDVAFSPNREHFVYSTWSSALHLCSVNENTDHQEPLSLLKSGRRFCVFSVVFSSDGKELLGGANDGCLYIYDLEQHGRKLKIPAHEYDVNSVCFADESSHIIYSGGDDGHVKVWDRRTLDEKSPQPVGVLAGHVDGVTFIDSKGDGRHLISNSKDQSIKLWDVRVFSGSDAAEQSFRAVTEQTWDYRWQDVPKKLFTTKAKLEGDTSVMTYKGHVVIKTLVRCRFSPLHTSGQRYIYTGCGIGRVVVYDSLTGEVVTTLDGQCACVRDVDWHPYRNEILSSSWDGTVGKWSYSGPLDDDEEMWKDIEEESPFRRSSRLALKRRLKT
ncbi:unnamed protein product [Phaedon cochleariae]|uniref:DDB1- and CUL4-associated factor 11 n=1 Tax=Phaedon cochleariae TaxID=80249 RepID=A0A9P0DRH5_PHACE|nr:unnamed protein product [Phaedon cochleariae]